MPIVIGEKLGFALKSGGLIAGIILADKLWTGPSGFSSFITYRPTHGKQQEVSIHGAIRHPGIYLMGGDDSVYVMLRKAGGPMPPFRVCDAAGTARAAEAVRDGNLDADPWVKDTRWQDGRQKPRHPFRPPRYRL